VGTQLSDEAVAIRALGAVDLEPLLSLYEHLHAQDDPAPRDAAAIWERILLDPAHIYVGAFIDERLVAAGNASVIPNLTRGGRPYAVIENVVTHATYRRRGHASRVMRELISRCWQQRCYKIMLLSSQARADGHRLYEALGFDRVSKQAFVLSAR
jgi:GNAT superfamily N-acetyltransferase